MKTLFTWAACAAFVLAWGAAAQYFDHQRESVEAQDAITSRDWAARQVCGPNSTPVWQSDKELSCLTTKGRTASKQVAAVNP